MSVSGDYATPVQVNGFTCKNCTDVDYAKKHIDPQHPQSGPYGVNAQADPTQSPALRFGDHGKAAKNDHRPQARPADGTGLTLDISV